ncbi:efflux transporter outer membrane subunit [Rugamonas apoptosis]|uniref:efflux transporter outer membrane subunit n=1 Tax=Rugamonas apoptosis TaxID=2758570 RepID=UPI002882F769|nr:efflux transporter outer membrane subunit [Rugamonas apoptosis]
MKKLTFKQFPLDGRRLGLAVLFALAVTGCAVGPDFYAPAPPPGLRDDSYTPAAMPSDTASAPVPGGASQHLVIGQDIPAQWWSVFHSPELDRLVRSALEHNPTMAAAEAALREAQENYNAERGGRAFPAINAQLSAAREHQADQGKTVNGVFSLYNASVNVSYAPDVFGSTRRALEGAQAAIDYQRFQVEAAQLALTANVVTAAIREASLRAQLQATAEVLAAQRKQMDVIDQQLKAGAVARSVLLTQRSQVAQTAATVPPLEKALALSRHALSVLAGQLPSTPDLPQFELASLTLPEQLPLSLPSALARQRPDVRASEALLHQASAQVGVATANLYPQFTLSGSYGVAGASPHQLFKADNVFWNLAAGLTQPLFNGGALTAKRRAAEAAYDAAAAQYRATVLGAFQNVADSLRALEFDANALQAQADAESLAAESLALAKRQYELGAISYLGLLDAQRSYQQTHIALVQAQAARYADTAALFQALGGGWWNRPPGGAAAP